MDENELIQFISTQNNEESSQYLKEKISAYINDLIRNDFHKLITILYRIDIDEEKLKKLLRANAGEDAGEIIAQLIIEREKQKIENRKQFKKRK